MKGAKYQMKEPLISVIVPVFNIEKYISRCVESIIGQTYSNLQIILVDDGSIDSSGEICDAYAKRDDRIQVIHQKNGGLVIARKAGLAVAIGEYIGFVDGDDYIEHNFYETLLNFILEEDVDFVHTGYVYEKNGVSINQCKFESNIYELDKDTAVKIINDYFFGVDEEKYITFGIVSKLFRSDFIIKCYDEVPDSQSYGEDLLCSCVCLLSGKRASFHREALYHYVCRPDSFTHSKEITLILKAARLYDQLYELFGKHKVISGVEVNLNRHFIDFIASNVLRNDRFSDFVNTYIFSEIDLIKDKRVVIYGAGAVGRGYYTQISKYASCVIVGWVDKDYKNINYDYSDVIGIEEIKNLKYDMILIAVNNTEKANDIKKQLHGIGVPEQKILWKKPRTLV